jgi:hypothetical protein
LPPKANSSSLRRGKQRKKTLCEESERESETDVDENKPHPSVKALLLCFSPFGVLLFVVVFVVFERERERWRSTMPLKRMPTTNSEKKETKKKKKKKKKK